LDHDYLLIDLQELSGGNVLVGPKVGGEMRVQSREIMIGLNREERPWKSELHFHERSKEFYIILKGGLTLRVGDESVKLGSNQMLVVKEGVPHTIEEFDLPIEFFTIRAPAIDDKVVLKDNP
jgi:mannose-6-phosphate isomerase-like protein (cupin superfamily)